MGCGSSMNQVSDSYHSMSSSKPLKIQQMFENSQSPAEHNKLYLFGQTQMKRKILELSLDQKLTEIHLKKISEKFHIPRPKIERDPIEMMYQQAQEVFPLNMYNSTTLPPFNLMFVTSLSERVIFMCGGVDFQFWNVCAETFLYKIANQNQNQRIKKDKVSKPQTQIIPQKTNNNREPTIKKAFNKFQRLAFMNEGRYSHAGISIRHPATRKNVAYVFGGYGSNKQALKSCEMFTFQKNTWQKIPDMSIARATCFCFEYLQKIYVFGGFSSDKKRSKKIQVWDLNQQRWEILNIKIHQGIQQGFITTFKPNQIIIMGGNTEGGSLNSVIRCNIIEQTYKWDSNLLYSDSLQKGIQNNNKIYLLGGLKPFTCQVYSQTQKNWKQYKISSQQQIKAGQLTLSSAVTQPLYVQHAPSSNRNKYKQFTKQDVFLIGTDIYPIILTYSSKDLYINSRSVPMRIRLRKNMGIVRLSQDQYFLCGGIDSFQTNPTKATFNYNLSTGIGTQLAKMPLKKYNFGIYKKDHFVYCVGGCIKNDNLEQVEIKDSCRFNLIKKQWEKLPQLNCRRSQCQIVAVNNGLLIFGGYCEGQWVQKVQYLKVQPDNYCQFILLSQRIPLLYPFYSEIIDSNNQSKNQHALMVINRNIQQNHFQEIYFQINTNKVSQKDLNYSKSSKKLAKIEQFDSIQVIIKQKKQTIQKQSENNSLFFKKNKSPTINQQEGNDSLIINNSNSIDCLSKTHNQQKDNKQNSNKIIGKKQINQIYQQENVKNPTVIMIKSKPQRQQSQQKNHSKSKKKIQYTYQVQNFSSKSKNSGERLIKQDDDDYIQNQIQQQFSDHPEEVQQLSAQFNRIKLADQLSQGNLVNKNLKKVQKFQKIRTQPFQQLQQSQQNINLLKDKAASTYNLQKKPQMSHSQIIYSDPQILEGYTKGPIKGLEIIDNPNEWLVIKQLNKVVFVNNQDIVKCSFQNNKNQEIKISVVRQKYQSEEKLFQQQNKQKTNKIHTKFLCQRYG